MSTLRRILIALAVALAAAGPAAAASVVVAPGETLSHIAARNGVSVAALAAANGIADPDHVVAGTRLVLPGTGGSGPTTSGTATSGGATVRVARGETLSHIAARIGVSVGALARANGIADPDMVRAGTVLRVPGAGSPGGTAPVPAAPAAVGRAQVRALLDAAAARRGVDPALARAIAWQESGWSMAARSHVGAIGVMQLMPATARWLGPALLGRRIDPYSASDNVEGGVAYLAWLIRTMGSERLAIAAYYQGQGSVQANGLLAETERYVASVSALRGRV